MTITRSASRATSSSSTTSAEPLHGNRIDGNLQCKENVPDPVGGEHGQGERRRPVRGPRGLNERRTPARSLTCDFMVARQSQLFIPTLREPPADAEAVSHKLLVRGGYIRQVSTGVWTFLPLGWRVHQKVVQIVREEMDAIGGQEMLMPVLTPLELWVQTGRDFIPEIFQPPGPERARVRASADARGDGHVPREGDLELPAAPAAAVPLLDQGARRAALARRAPATARVHHEGRLLVRPRRGRPRRRLPQERSRVPPHVRARRARVLRRAGGVAG